MTATLVEGECLHALAALPSRSVQLVLCDLPYGTTQNPWDSVVPLDALWRSYRRILKPTGAVVLTSQGLFTARLMLSNEPWFRYKLVWIKSKATNFLNAKRQPLRKHEDVCVFAPGQPTYHPQMQPGEPYDKGRRKAQQTGSYGDFAPVVVKSDGDRCPTDVVYFATAESEGPVEHPTQKPLALMRYLIRTYSDPGDLVLDNTCGSGSTLVAAVTEGRRALGIELNQGQSAFRGRTVDMIDVAARRLREAGVESVVIRGLTGENLSRMCCSVLLEEYEESVTAGSAT